MAAEKHTSSTSYPSQYSSNTPFADEEILEAAQMNFIANNINVIITALTWNGEASNTSKTALVSNVQMGDET